jgi:hypothetical protein
MTDTQTAIYVALAMVFVFGVVLGGIFLHIRREKALKDAHQRALEAAAPTNWQSIGVTPPPGLSVALEVIQASYKHLPDHGTIEWVTDPFMVAGSIKAAGTVLWYEPAHIKLMTGAKVEETALAHEMLHLDDYYRTGGTGCARESPKDADFVAEFQAVNAAIKKALSA